MNSTLQLIASNSLPALSGNSLTYNVEKNIYLTTGYTSAAGNTYYRAIRVSNRLVVYYHIGEGYWHTFLNGISLYAFDGTNVHIISEQFFNRHIFNEHDACEQSISMLVNFLKGQAKLLGTSISDNQLYTFSKKMIGETYQRQLR